MNLEVVGDPLGCWEGDSAGGYNPKEGLNINRFLRDCAQRYLKVFETFWKVRERRGHSP